jgi:ATP-binding cassette subfamily B protein
MPKIYTMGGRASSAPPDNISPAPQQQSWRERLGALRNLPPFLKLVWRTSPALTLSQSLLRVVRALLPVATLYVGKLIIDEVVLLAQAPPAAEELRQWIASGLLDRIGWLLALEFGLAVLSDVLGRAVSLLDSLLSERFQEPRTIGIVSHGVDGNLQGQARLADSAHANQRQQSGAFHESPGVFDLALTSYERCELLRQIVAWSRECRAATRRASKVKR